MKQKFIVGEVSKEWRNGQHVNPSILILSRAFEILINTNLERGYALHSWRMNQVFSQGVNGSILTESIVAVFKEIKQ